MSDTSAVAFADAMTEMLGVAEPLPLAARLQDDLGLDSFDLIRLLLWLEEGFEVVARQVPLPALDTVQDALDYRRSLTDYRGLARP